MEISRNALKKILLGLIALTVLLSSATIYFYFPTLINRLGLNKTPSKEVQEILDGYNMAQSTKRYKDLDEKVAKIAKESPSLNIASCTPYPRIIKAEIDSVIRIENPDSRQHVLNLRGMEITLRPKETKEIVMDFMRATPVSLPYNCDNLNNFAGVLYIPRISN